MTLGFEDQRSQILPPLPVDMARRDFRLPKNHPALAAGAFPQGPVPDCILNELGPLGQATQKSAEP